MKNLKMASESRAERTKIVLVGSDGPVSVINTKVLKMFFV